MVYYYFHGDQMFNATSIDLYNETEVMYSSESSGDYSTWMAVSIRTADGVLRILWCVDYP